MVSAPFRSDIKSIMNLPLPVLNAHFLILLLIVVRCTLIFTLGGFNKSINRSKSFIINNISKNINNDSKTDSSYGLSFFTKGRNFSRPTNLCDIRYHFYLHYDIQIHNQLISSSLNITIFPGMQIVITKVFSLNQ